MTKRCSQSLTRVSPGGLEGMKLPGEFLPVNVDRVSQMFGLHMAPFSLEGLGTNRRQ